MVERSLCAQIRTKAHKNISFFHPVEKTPSTEPPPPELLSLTDNTDLLICSMFYQITECDDR